MTRINTRRAATVGIASFATLALVPLLGEAKPGERAVLLLAALPTAALFGYLAGYAAGSTTRVEAAHRRVTGAVEVPPRGSDPRRLSLVPPTADDTSPVVGARGNGDRHLHVVDGDEPVDLSS